MVIIEFKLSTEEFTFQGTLAAFPDVTTEIERVVADDPEQITPYVRAYTDNVGTLRIPFQTISRYLAHQEVTPSLVATLELASARERMLPSTQKLKLSWERDRYRCRPARHRNRCD